MPQIKSSQQKDDDFWEKVVQVVKQIPEGRVTSYGAIASFLGLTKSARMVGYALNNCKHLQHEVPAHRVVNRNGLLTGKHNFEGNSMQEKLMAEGVLVENDQVINFKTKFWNPEELIK